jgi:hypothetical protein
VVSGHIARLLLALATLASLGAAEVRLVLPDPLFAGVVQRGAVTIENAGSRVDHVDLPEVAGLEWQTRGGTNYEIRMVNGARSTKETMPLVLRAQAAADLVVPAVTVVFSDGSTATTAPVTVHPQAPDTSLTGEVQASATFEPATIVPGEPATLVYRLALRQDRARAIKQPALTPPIGLLVTGERSDGKSETTDAEGREWSIQTWRWPVTAASAGSFEARGQQEWFRCRQELFNQLVIESTHQAPIRPGVLTVTTMPDLGRPDDFGGLIGPVEASAAIERTRIAAGEGTVFTVTLKGPQVGLCRRPALVLPAGVQAYPKDDDDRTKGERHFRWDLVPGTVGELTIPALSFPYFSPATRTYLRAGTAAITVVVIPGRSRELVVSGNTAVPEKAAATSMVAQRLVLPPPVRGEARAQAPLGWSWWLLGGGIALGGGIGLGQRLRTRAARAPHRGRGLAAALAARDLEAMARWVFLLRPDLDADGRRAADALEQAIDRARFGSDQPGDLQALALPLVGIA